MKTVIRLDVTDEQRNALAQLLARKPVKRLATREEVDAYVQGIVAQLADGVTPETFAPEVPRCFEPKPEVADIPISELARANAAATAAIAGGRLTEAGRLSYVRGFVLAGRSARATSSASERQGN